MKASRFAISVYYGGIGGSAVSAARRRLRERAADTDLIDRLRAKLGQLNGTGAIKRGQLNGTGLISDTIGVER